MPNIGTVLKSEISRIARKEVRGETQSLKQSVAQYRTQIAAMKRRMQVLEQQIKRLGKATAKAIPSAAAATREEAGSNLRFSAKGFATQRQRLGLSAPALASLLGVSAQSVYKWEEGKTRPRAKQLEAIAALRGMGKKAAAARLEELAG